MKIPNKTAIAVSIETMTGPLLGTEVDMVIIDDGLKARIEG
jgi:hypothetical protein